MRKQPRTGVSDDSYLQRALLLRLMTHDVGASLPDACLAVAARWRASGMGNRQYFSHRTPDGRSPWSIVRMQGCAFHGAGIGAKR